MCSTFGQFWTSFSQLADFEVEGCWVVGVELDDIFGFGGLCEEGGYSEEVEEEIYLAVFE